MKTKISYTIILVHTIYGYNLKNRKKIGHLNLNDNTFLRN